MGQNDLKIGLKWIKWGQEVLNIGTEFALNGGQHDQGPKNPKFFYPIEMRLTKAASGCCYWHSLRSSHMITAPDVNKADNKIIWEVERKKKKLESLQHLCKDVGIRRGDNEAVSCLLNDTIFMEKNSLTSPKSKAVFGLDIWTTLCTLACFWESAAPPPPPPPQDSTPAHWWTLHLFS